MANQLEKPKSEENMCLESHIVPTKEVKKVDEQLTIEFTDIKQEPRYHSDNYQKFQEIKKEIKSECISCNIFVAKTGHSDGMAAIHEKCFQKLCTRLYLANDKVQDLEFANKNMIGTIETLERNNEDLSGKLTSLRKEIQNISKEKEILDSSLTQINMLKKNMNFTSLS